MCWSLGAAECNSGGEEPFSSAASSSPPSSPPIDLRRHHEPRKLSRLRHMRLCRSLGMTLPAVGGETRVASRPIASSASSSSLSSPKGSPSTAHPGVATTRPRPLQRIDVVAPSSEARVGGVSATLGVGAGDDVARGEPVMTDEAERRRGVVAGVVAGEASATDEEERRLCGVAGDELPEVRGDELPVACSRRAATRCDARDSAARVSSMWAPKLFVRRRRAAFLSVGLPPGLPLPSTLLCRHGATCGAVVGMMMRMAPAPASALTADQHLIIDRPSKSTLQPRGRNTKYPRPQPRY